MGFLGLFGKPDKALDIAEKATSGIAAGIDKMFFTNEEKAEAAQKVMDTHLKMIEATASENTVRSKTRRYLALMIIGTFLYLLVFGAMIFRFDPGWAKHSLGCAKSLSPMAFAIGVFYFGYYGIKSLLAGKKKK
jgi:hypothetical protein